MSRGHFMRSAHELTDRHFNREVTVDGLTGSLVGLIPVGDEVTLALIIGGSRAWKTVPAAEPVEIQSKETTTP